MLGQQCWDTLCLYVAIVWPGLHSYKFVMSSLTEKILTNTWGYCL